LRYTVSELACGFAGDVAFVYPEVGGQVFVDYHLRIGAIDNRTQREPGLPRHPDRPNQHDLKRDVERLGDLKTKRRAARGKASTIGLSSLRCCSR
jgi:hypothetical protein